VLFCGYKRCSVKGMLVKAVEARDEGPTVRAFTPMQSFKRFSQRFCCITTTVLLLMALFMPITPAVADDDQPVACDQSEDIGSVFYDFDTLIIWYVDFMGHQERKPGFPEALKYENFNPKLVEAVKKNFALCLKTADGKDKPFIVIPPFQVKISGKPEYDPTLIHNPKHLTILIRGGYFPQYEFTPGMKGFGNMQFFMYRPEVPHKLARLPLGNNSGVINLPLQTGSEDWEKTLNGFFKAIRPFKVGGARDAKPTFIESAKIVREKKETGE
jgi:hypothetical protein